MLKTKYLLPLILILLLSFTLIGDCDWLPGWDYRIELEIADYAGDIGGSVTWFPVEVFLTATQCEEVFVELTTDAEYKKMQFTENDGTSLLYGHKKLFDVSEVLGIFTVSAGGWTIDGNTSVWLYYDKDHADNDTYIGAINTAACEAVYNAEFVAVYPMDNGADTSHIYDATDNNNDGTKESAGHPAEVAGQVGQAQDFDGSQDYIEVADSADFDFAAGFTVEVAVNPDNTDAPGMLLSRWDAGSGDGFYLEQSAAGSGIWRFDVYVGGSHDVIVSDAAPSSAFQHLSVVRAANGVLNMYINGVAQTDTGTQSGAIDSNEKLYFGCWIDHTALFAGIEDEVRVSEGARSAAWNKGTYNSLWDSLFTYGSEETEAVVQNVMFLFSDY